MFFFFQPTSGFKLVELDLKYHKILGTNTFNFVSDKDDPSSIYSTVLIGPNGTGKSEILKLLLKLFRNIFVMTEDNSPEFIDGYFNLIYTVNGVKYEYSNFTGNPEPYRDLGSGKLKNAKHYLKREDVFVSNMKPDQNLPNAIIANSIMLTDKYFVPRNKKEQDAFPMYKYLGVRNRPQQASTRSYVRKTVEFVVQQIDSPKFKSGLKKITEFLGFSNNIDIEYRTINTPKFFSGNISKQYLDVYFEEIEGRYKKLEKIAPFKVSHYFKYRKNPNFIDELCSYVNDISRNEKWDKIYRSSSKILRFNILNDVSKKELKANYKYLDALREIGVVSPPEIKFGQSNINIKESSSGEFHFFSTMVGLMATVKENSLILIDEPEISLHPNWQMKYLHFIRVLLSDKIFRSCHIIIATHSHFLVSDLEGSSSKIIGLKKESGVIGTIDIDKNTYGWSAEQVLLDVFEVSTSRNYYIAERLGELMDFIANPDNSLKEIKNKYEDLGLDKIDSLSELDPLNDVLKRIRKKYVV